MQLSLPPATITKLRLRRFFEMDAYFHLAPRVIADLPLSEAPGNKMNCLSKVYARTRLLRRKNYCHYCGKTLTADTATIEHVTPRMLGGTNKLANLTLACCDCNAFRGETFFRLKEYAVKNKVDFLKLYNPVK